MDLNASKVKLDGKELPFEHDHVLLPSPAGDRRKITIKLIKTTVPRS